MFPYLLPWGQKCVSIALFEIWADESRFDGLMQRFLYHVHLPTKNYSLVCTYIHPFLKCIFIQIVSLLLMHFMQHSTYIKQYPLTNRHSTNVRTLTLKNKQKNWHVLEWLLAEYIALHLLQGRWWILSQHKIEIFA